MHRTNSRMFENTIVQQQQSISSLVVVVVYENRIIVERTTVDKHPSWRGGPSRLCLSSSRMISPVLVVERFTTRKDRVLLMMTMGRRNSKKSIGILLLFVVGIPSSPLLPAEHFTLEIVSNQNENLLFVIYNTS